MVIKRLEDGDLHWDMVEDLVEALDRVAESFRQEITVNASPVELEMSPELKLPPEERSAYEFEVIRDTQGCIKKVIARPLK